MQHLTLDEAMERRRRAMLHRQIAALDVTLDALGSPVTPKEQRRFYKLLTKKRRLRHQLDQGVFGVAS